MPEEPCGRWVKGFLFLFSSCEGREFSANELSKELHQLLRFITMQAGYPTMETNNIAIPQIIGGRLPKRCQRNRNRLQNDIRPFDSNYHPSWHVHVNNLDRVARGVPPAIGR